VLLAVPSYLSCISVISHAIKGKFLLDSHWNFTIFDTQIAINQNSHFWQTRKMQNSIFSWLSWLEFCPELKSAYINQFQVKGVSEFEIPISGQLVSPCHEVLKIFCDQSCDRPMNPAAEWKTARKQFSPCFELSRDNYTFKCTRIAYYSVRWVM
jgi:hypothetical protein